MNLIRHIAKKLTFLVTLFAATAAVAVATAGSAAAQTMPTPIVLARPNLIAGKVVTFPSTSMPAVKAATAATPAAATKAATSPAAGAPTKAVTPRATFPARPVPPAAGLSDTPSSGNVHAALESAAFASGAEFNAPLPDEKMLHLVLGHSIFIDTKHRLSRVYITNPDVLNSYTSNPNQVVITAKQIGLSTLIVWDEMGDTQVYMVSSETDAGGLTDAIKKAFPMDDIDVKSANGRLTLTGTVGTQARADAVGKLAALYSKDISNALFVNSSKIKQVRLKVRFAEVDRSRISQFGFNLFAVLNGNGANPTLVQSTTGAFSSTISAGGNSTTSTGGLTVGGQTVSVTNPLNFVLYNASHNIGATIQDLEDKQIMHILAEPNITAMSGQKSNFLAGGEFPFPIVQGGASGTAASVTVEFKPYGVKLEFLPIVNADGTIDLTVAPEVSALDYSNAVTISGFTIPALSTRRAQTEVVLHDGQSFAISGLLDQRTTDALGRTPGIASVPILGALFRSKNINHSTSELVVIVTPEIVDPLNDHVPADPTSPVPLLNPQQFDTTLPNMVKKPSAAK